MIVKIREIEMNRCSPTAKYLLLTYVEDYTLNLLASDVQAGMMLDDRDGSPPDRILDIG